ncbi:MAG: hypothetical protein Q9171_006784 [Xanthocarpia ochracea]
MYEISFTAFSLPTRLLTLEPVIPARRHFVFPLTAAPGPEHQCRGCDPEEEYEDFGGQTGDGVFGATTGEGVGAMGAVDAVPPRAMGARVADEDEKGDAEEKLADADEVEKLGVTEERHVCVGLAVQCRFLQEKKLLDIESEVVYLDKQREGHAFKAWRQRACRLSLQMYVYATGARVSRS